MHSIALVSAAQDELHTGGIRPHSRGYMDVYSRVYGRIVQAIQPYTRVCSRILRGCGAILLPILAVMPCILCMILLCLLSHTVHPQNVKGPWFPNVICGGSLL